MNSHNNNRSNKMQMCLVAPGKFFFFSFCIFMNDYLHVDGNEYQQPQWQHLCLLAPGKCFLFYLLSVLTWTIIYM